MAFLDGFSKLAKLSKEELRKQKLITAIPAAVALGGGGYSLYHYAKKNLHDMGAYTEAAQAVREAKRGGMSSPFYQVHKANARRHMLGSVKSQKHSRIGAGIYVGGVLGTMALGHIRGKEERDKNIQMALKKSNSMKKTALSKETIQNAVHVAQKKVSLIPPGMHNYAGIKPIEQLKRLRKALTNKK